MVSVSLDEIIFQELGDSNFITSVETRAKIREIYIREIAKDNCFDGNYNSERNIQEHYFLLLNNYLKR